MLLHSVETFYGFIKDVEDAHLLVEACIGGLFEPVRDISVSGSSLAIRSGSVVVLQESVSSTSSTSMRMRWRDGRQWSSSKLCGSFLLYREVERTRSSPRLEAEESALFSGLSLRSGTQLVPNGFAKRTISIDGSDGSKYRVISYVYPRDVEDHFRRSKKNHLHTSALQTPSRMGHLDQFKSKVKQMTRIYTNCMTPPSPTPRLQSLPSPYLGRSCSFRSMQQSGAQKTQAMMTSSSCQGTCQCGGLGSLSVFDYFRRDSSWALGPVVLAPIGFSRNGSCE